jgi:predicted alpha/beta-fold hydrolase
MNSTYRSPPWLPGGHLQTIVPALWLAPPAPPLLRERWATHDGDFVDVDFTIGAPGMPTVVLFHGLEGSSQSHYARALMLEVARRGWTGVVPHFRGCSGEANLAPRFYHSGDAGEIDWILRRLRARTTGALYATGVSLGGNALLRWLGESQHGAEIVDAACAVSAPLDLARGGQSLGAGFNMVYTRMFLRTLVPKCLAKLEQYPGLFDRTALLAARDLYQFDNVVTAPLHGYRDTDDYWHRASAKHVLGDITVPTLVLNARNDPFLPEQYLPRTAARAVTLEYPAHGGHVGFADGRRLDWLPRHLLDFLEGRRAPATQAPWETVQHG